MIFALGMTSLFTNTDVIDTPGLTAVPGVAGIVVSAIGFAARARRGAAGAASIVLHGPVGRTRRRLAYLVGVWVGALFSGATRRWPRR